jgi:hypothetical protein
MLKSISMAATPRRDFKALLRRSYRKLIGSVWLFPLILTILLLGFTGLKVSGSSLEIYRYILGDPQGRSLIANQPEAIRSDEWLVATQMTIAQKHDNFQEVNKNIGNGQDMSLSGGIPYKDWSTFFHPENWLFFVAPFNYAFAFKWWLMAYVLMLSCYFFVLAILPNKRLLAAMLSVFLYFSPFVQWWYQLATLGSIFYPLILGILFIYMLRAKTLRSRLLLATSITYSAVAFALVLYPPFMIAVSFVVGMACLGYLIEQRGQFDSTKALLKRLLWVLVPLVLSGLIVGIFLLTRSDAVHAINNTVYPGRRISPGGGFGISRLFSGFLDVQLQNAHRFIYYKYNQSENSNFLLVAPFLFLPSLYLLYKKYKKNKSTDWPLLLVNLTLLLLMVRFFSTILDPLFKFVFFTKVPSQRLLIGLGVLNILQIVFFIRHAKDLKRVPKHWLIAAYSLCVLIIEAGLALWTHHDFPGYVGVAKCLLLALPIPVAVYLLLRRKFALGVALLMVFSVYSTYKVNPLYHSTAPLTDTSITTAIKNVGGHSNGKWIAESLYYENFPQMVGVPSLSGVYDYPQLSIWKNLPPHNSSIYNRYAHVVFVIDHQGTGNFKTHLQLVQDDTFVVVTEPCSSFLRQNNVQFILAQAPIYNSCVSLVQQVPYPNQTFFIYHINKQ